MKNLDNIRYHIANLLINDYTIINYNSKIIYCSTLSFARSFYMVYDISKSRDININGIVNILSFGKPDSPDPEISRDLYISPRHFNELRAMIKDEN